MMICCFDKTLYMNVQPLTKQFIIGRLFLSPLKQQGIKKVPPKSKAVKKFRKKSEAS